MHILQASIGGKHDRSAFSLCLEFLQVIPYNEELILKNGIEFLYENLSSYDHEVWQTAVAGLVSWQWAQFGPSSLYVGCKEGHDNRRIVLGAEALHVDRAAVFGSVVFLFENVELGIYLLRIRPGARIAAHCHLDMAESEMVLTDGVYAQGKPVVSGTRFCWQRGVVHGYDNPTCEEQVVLCINEPRFDPVDERPVWDAFTIVDEVS